MMSTMTAVEPSTAIERANPHILLVEDNPEDLEATIRGLTRSGLANPIHHCASGDDALDYLYRRGRYDDYATSPWPGIVLLDLNLPGTDGREVLRNIKSDGRLKNIPVVVLTSSADERDINACYDAGANSYLQKPVNLDGFMRALQMLKDYWFQIVILPRPHAARRAE